MLTPSLAFLCSSSPTLESPYNSASSPRTSEICELGTLGLYHRYMICTSVNTLHPVMYINFWAPLMALNRSIQSLKSFVRFLKLKCRRISPWRKVFRAVRLCHPLEAGQCWGVSVLVHCHPATFPFLHKHCSVPRESEADSNLEVSIAKHLPYVEGQRREKLYGNMHRPLLIPSRGDRQREPSFQRLPGYDLVRREVGGGGVQGQGAEEQVVQAGGGSWNWRWGAEEEEEESGGAACQKH